MPLHIRYTVAFLFHFVILSTMHASRLFPPRFGLRCSVLSSMRRPVFSPSVSWWDICEFTVGVYAEFLVSYTVHSSRKSQISFGRVPHVFRGCFRVLLVYVPFCFPMIFLMVPRWLPAILAVPSCIHIVHWILQTEPPQMREACRSQQGASAGGKG